MHFWLLTFLLFWLFFHFLHTECCLNSIPLQHHFQQYFIYWFLLSNWSLLFTIPNDTKLVGLKYDEAFLQWDSSNLFPPNNIFHVLFACAKGVEFRTPAAILCSDFLKIALTYICWNAFCVILWHQRLFVQKSGADVQTGFIAYFWRKGVGHWTLLLMLPGLQFH